MKTLALVSAACLALTFSSPAAFAHVAHTSGGTTAAIIAAAVANSGAAVVATGPNTFERFVANQSGCDLGETAMPFDDSGGNYLGLVCEPNVFGGRK